MAQLPPDQIARTQAALRQALHNLEQTPRWRTRLIKYAKLSAGPVLVIALLTVGFMYREPVTGWLQIRVAEATGAQVQSITVEGAAYTNPDALRDALQLAKGDSLVTYNTSEARERLEALPWVRLASVEKQLPDTLKVTVYEHVPLARLQDDEGLWVVNKEGEKIEQDNANRFASLPVVQGEGAAQAAAALFEVLGTWPNLMGQLDEASLIGGRRWDMSFKSGVTVKLPESNPTGALAILEELEKQRHVLSLSGGEVDLRLPERIVLKIPPEVEQNPTTNAPTGATNQKPM